MPQHHRIASVPPELPQMDRDQQARELCETGLQHMWRGEVEPALELYTRALELAADDELREVITIRKAEALIAADQEGPEVSALAQIVMRRRSPRHVYMAATVLLRRYSEKEDRRRAIFYGKIGRKAAAEMREPLARASVLNGLGITLAADSDFDGAIAAFDEALAALSLLDPHRDEVRSFRPSIVANLGGTKVVSGDVEDGIRLLEKSLPLLDEDYAVAEACLDLCLGYSELEQYNEAELFGRRALTLATKPRQIRNGNHLLAMIASRSGKHEQASQYFDVVASFYPDFKNVKELLLAVDLGAVVNWKA